MDIVNFWRDVVSDFNITKDENGNPTEEGSTKCGFCWFFGAPLSGSAANAQNTPEGSECCVHLLVTETSKNSVKGYSGRTGLLNSQFDDYTFTILVARQDDIGTNMYNEQLDHEIPEGKWASVLRPLQECLDGNGELERLFCDILGEQLRITSWRMRIKKNYQDQNFTGWEIFGTFRKQII